MEDDNTREENNEVTGDVRNDETAESQERGSNQYQLIPKSTSNRKAMRNEQYDRLSRSRSRSRNKSSRRKQWRSANAFLNFMQDFRQDYNKIKSRDLLRLGGQKWRQMSSIEKMPYVEAAKIAQQSQNNKSEQQTKSNDIAAKKTDNEQKKKEREKRKERKRSRSKTDDSDIESDSATSGTGATMTSEDISDLSS